MYVTLEDELTKEIGKYFDILGTEVITVTPTGTAVITPSAPTVADLEPGLFGSGGIDIELDPNASVEFTFTLTAKDPLPDGYNIATNTAHISGDIDDNDDAQIPTIPSIPGLHPEEKLTKEIIANNPDSDGDGDIKTVSNGDVLTYELTIGALAEDASLIHFEDRLESQYLKLVSPDGNIKLEVDGVAASGKITNNSLPSKGVDVTLEQDVKKGSIITLEFDVIVEGAPDDGTISNIAKGAVDGTDTNSDTETVTTGKDVPDSDLVAFKEAEDESGNKII